MKKLWITLFVFLLFAQCSLKKEEEKIYEGVITGDSLMFHPIRIDSAGKMLPWFSANAGQSYDTVLMLVWNFWDRMETDSNGLKYYMNHQVWKPQHDKRGLGGDQLNMALSSWRLLYQYTGNRAIIDNMCYIADTYLACSLSDSSDAWPFIPYPYNTSIHSGYYDGDMILGKGYTQPDKAGSFGYELVNLYKLTGRPAYLNAAIRIATTLISKIKPGDSLHSPLPFKVHAKTGKVGVLKNRDGEKEACYTTNWAPTLRLFEELFTLDKNHASDYRQAFNVMLQWMMKYPMQNNRWGPFFEDIPGWSDTQINAITWADFIMDHIEPFPHWFADVKKIFEWVEQKLGNHEWEKYGVLAINEQTAYQVPGNSHTSRMAAAQLKLAKLTQDKTLIEKSIRQLNWATYMVNHNGENQYYHDDIWLTDGYGDYVRHYLNAMAAYPEIAPDHKNRLLSSSSVVQHISYGNKSIFYRCYDARHREVFRLTAIPRRVMVGGIVLPKVNCDCRMGWHWRKLQRGGVLTISTDSGNETTILF